MAILGLVQTQIPIPHEPGEWVMVRTKLPPLVRIRAQEVVRVRAMADASRLLAEMTPQQLEAMTPDAAKQRAAAEINGEADLTREQVCLDTAAAALVTSWSYKHPETGVAISPTFEMIQSLDETTRDWLHNLAWEALKPEDPEGN